MQRIDPARLEAVAAALGDAIPIAPPLVAAWRQLHHAAQIAAEVGKSWAVPQPDDSHSNFEWRDGSLVGASVPAPRPFRAALRAQDLALRLVAEDGAVLAARMLAGATVAEASSWVRAQAALFAGSGERQPAVAAPDLPDHPVAHGAPFALHDRDAAAALVRLLGCADAVLRAIAAAAPSAPPVRIWPHHFDMAALIAPDPDRSIGVGLAVPDATEASGYWYVSSWSARPRGDALPMATLALDAWARIEKRDERSRTLAAFLADSIAARAAQLGI
jgi:hypothetical protein